MTFTRLYNNSERNTRHLLEEANLGQLYKKTKQGYPLTDDRAMQLIHSVKFIGISDDNITLNFKVGSQTYPGQFYYVSIEAPSLITEFSYLYQGKESIIQPTLLRKAQQLLGGMFTPEHYNEFLLQKDFRVYCNDDSFLYWGSAYNATMGDYDINPETRDPVVRDPRHKRFMCKHLQAVVRCMYTDNHMKNQICKEINRILRKLANLPAVDEEAFAKGLQRGRGPRALLNNTSDFINNYFASKSNRYKFIEPNDVQKSLRTDINNYIHDDPEGNLDTYLRDKFSISKKSLANDMDVPQEEIDEYFDELGFTPKEEKVQRKQQIINNLQNSVPEDTDTEDIQTEEPVDDNKPNIL